MTVMKRGRDIDVTGDSKAGGGGIVRQVEGGYFSDGARCMDS